MIMKDGSIKLLTALTFTLLVSVLAQVTLSATIMTRQNATEELARKINDDYTPMFVVQAIVESNNLMTQEIVGIREADIEKVRAIQAKYIDLQKMVIQQMSHSRSVK